MRNLLMTGVLGAALAAVPVGAARVPGQDAKHADPGAQSGTPSGGERVANDRQKKIADDTAKLLQLATELKTSVDKTSKDEMSLEVIHKADEIEKLAHDLKLRMKP